MNAWASIEAATGWTIPAWVRQGCVGPKLVTIPAGRELFAAGPAHKERMDWGAFEENDIGWYLEGNQLDPSWYLGGRTEPIPLYEYGVVLREPTRAIISKVATQGGAPLRAEPSKFQYYSPIGLGTPTRLRLLGHLEVDGRFVPVPDAASPFHRGDSLRPTASVRPSCQTLGIATHTLKQQTPNTPKKGTNHD